MFLTLLANQSVTAVMSGAPATTQPTYTLHSVKLNQRASATTTVASLTGTTPVTLLSAPNQIQSLYICNVDTAAVTITLKEASAALTITSQTLAVGDTLVIDADGMHVVDSNGNIKQTGSSAVRTGYTTQVGTRAKVGGTAGWVVAAATDLPYVATMAASQTAGTLVIPIDGLHIGDTITGFKIHAQIESAGNAVTLDAALRAVTNAAAEPTDAAIGSITQVSVTADTASAASKTGLTEVVTSGKSYYLLITGTTLGSTDIILQHCEITVTTAA